MKTVWNLTKIENTDGMISNVTRKWPMCVKNTVWIYVQSIHSNLYSFTLIVSNFSNEK